MGNVEAAVGWYKHSLSLREQAVQDSKHAGASEQLDVAVSTIKVADACQVRLYILQDCILHCVCMAGGSCSFVIFSYSSHCKDHRLCEAARDIMIYQAYLYSILEINPSGVVGDDVAAAHVTAL